MFESLVYKNGIGPGPLINIGALAESLIFYGHVSIVCNSATIRDLLKRIPPFILLKLLQDRRLVLLYLEDQLGVSTIDGSNGRQVHNLMKFSSPDHTIEKIAAPEFRNVAGHSSQAKIAAKQFSRMLRSFDHSSFDQNAILQGLGQNYATEESAKSLIQTLVPNFNYSRDFYFRIEKEKEGILVDTNLDFNALNACYHRTIPVDHSSMSPAYVLALIQGAYEATYYAATLNSEVAVNRAENVVLSSAVKTVADLHNSSSGRISRFVDLILDDTSRIRDAVNSGAVPFASVLRLLDASDKFRSWLTDQPPERDLLKAYYLEVTKDSWVEKLPGKSLRWSVFAGLGLGLEGLGAGGLGVPAGLALSAMDTFLLDKLFKGWKPHQFVETELKPVFAKKR